MNASRDTPWRSSPTFSAPEQLVKRLQNTSRSTFILDHGFSDDQLGTQWWRGKGIEITMPSNHSGTHRLTRSDLFRMGGQADTDESLLDFVWHVLAWGSGKSRRNNSARIDQCRGHVATLWSAIDSARDGDPRTAYSQLVRPGRAMIPHLGPAFFSKILYFATEHITPRCLILDARVARSLHRLGWSMAPTYSEGKRRFSYNWYTDTYVAYCQLLHRWGEEAGNGISADMFERALFDAARE